MYVSGSDQYLLTLESYAPPLYRRLWYLSYCEGTSALRVLALAVALVAGKRASLANLIGFSMRKPQPLKPDSRPL